MTLREEIDNSLSGFGLKVLGVVHLEHTLVLIGNVGRSISYLFEQKKFASIENDPLDNWSREVLEPVAKEFNARAIYPFEGPPFHPFISWAISCGEVYQSPLKIMIHPKYGLWHGYRGAIVFDGDVEIKKEVSQGSPCDSCAIKPCLKACSAFAARKSCPVGAEHRYCAQQLSFHMSAAKALGCL